MNLRDTVIALEQNNIQVATDIGVHQRCDIDSNCPVAVELRTLIRESEVTLQQLLEGYATSQEDVPALPIELPDFNAEVNLRIAGTQTPIDITSTVSGSLKRDIEDRLQELGYLKDKVRRAGMSLYQSYKDAIHEAKNTKQLPQLNFPIEEMVRYGCSVTTNGDYYLIFFRRMYQPEYIVTGGIRYKLADEDIQAIVREFLLIYTVSREGKIINVEGLDLEGSHFQHYHGRSYDCWGTVKLPVRWDGSLKQLAGTAYQLVAALKTINKDSIMQGHPPDMPNSDDIFARSTKLGEEGQLEEREQPAGAWTTEPDAPRRWGQRPATGRQEDLTPDEQEYMRRWGTRGGPGSPHAICALCGEAWLEHSNWHCRRDGE